MTELRIAPDLTLPVNAVTFTHGLLAMRGAGKSNTAVVLAEEMYDAGLPWVAVDPKGDWWGLRFPAEEGSGEGLPIPIFGGLHSDGLPLYPTSGGLVAALIVEKHLTCILDLSEMTKGEQTKFLIDFADRLFRLKNAHRFPLHLFLDEADEYIPQKLPSARGGEDQAKVSVCVGLFSKLVKQGRNRGIGVTMATQRAAVLNNDVLTQLDTLIAMRTTAKVDRDAIKGWVEYHAVSADLIRSLPELDDGAGWIWSPHAYKLMEQVRFRRRRTFDSGATPEIGEELEPPGQLTDVDVAALKEAMAETIERAKADDPKELRKQIAALKKQLGERPTEKVVETVTETVEVEVPVLSQEAVEALRAASGALHLTRDVLDAAMKEFATPGVRRPEQGVKREPRKTSTPPTSVPSRETTRRPVERPAPTADLDGVKLGKGEKKVLTVLAQFPNGRTYNELAFLAGYSAKASTLGVILANLRRGELVTRSGDPRITDEGRAAIGPVDPLPTGKELLEHWRHHERMGAGERKVLDVLVEQHPSELSHEELCDLAGYSPDASTMGVILSKLRKLGLVEKGARRLAPEFMEAISP